MPPEAAGPELTSHTMRRVWAGPGSAQKGPLHAPPSHHGCSLPQGITEMPSSSSPERYKSWAAPPNAQGSSSEVDQAAAVTLRSLQSSDLTCSLRAPVLLPPEWLKIWYPLSQIWLKSMVCKVLANIKKAYPMANLAWGLSSLQWLHCRGASCPGALCKDYRCL